MDEERNTMFDLFDMPQSKRPNRRKEYLALIVDEPLYPFIKYNLLK